MAVGKMPFATLGNTTAYLFFSHAALENKYKMLPTYCPRDELKFIPQAVIERSIHALGMN